MQSNIKEHELPETRGTFIGRLRRFCRRHGNDGLIGFFGAVCRGVSAVTDNRKFMIVMHCVSFFMVAACLWMAFRTGKYGTYLVSAGTIASLSLFWPEFTTRAMKKREKNADEQHESD